VNWTTGHKYARRSRRWIIWKIWTCIRKPGHILIHPSSWLLVEAFTTRAIVTPIAFWYEARETVCVNQALTFSIARVQDSHEQCTSKHESDYCTFRISRNFNHQFRILLPNTNAVTYYTSWRQGGFDGLDTIRQSWPEVRLIPRRRRGWRRACSTELDNWHDETELTVSTIDTTTASDEAQTSMKIDTRRQSWQEVRSTPRRWARKLKRAWQLTRRNIADRKYDWHHNGGRGGSNELNNWHAETELTDIRLTPRRRPGWWRVDSNELDCRNEEIKLTPNTTHTSA